MAANHPITLEALIEVKACVALGCLPGPGGLEDQTGGFPQMVKWLAAKGMLEGLTRGTLG